jgi:hypothetical protein
MEKNAMNNDCLITKRSVEAGSLASLLRALALSLVLVAGGGVPSLAEELAPGAAEGAAFDATELEATSAEESQDDAGTAVIATDSQNPLVFERTADTPAKLRLELPVSFIERSCLRFGQREVWGRHPSCGYTTEYIWRCYGYRPPYASCGYYPIQVMNTCRYLQSTCEQWGTVTVVRRVSVLVRFRNSTKLGAGQTERFELVASQAGESEYDVNFSLRALDSQAAYRISVRDRVFAPGKVITVKAAK